MKEGKKSFIIITAIISVILCGIGLIIGLLILNQSKDVKVMPFINPVVAEQTCYIEDGMPEIVLSKGDTAGKIYWVAGQEIKEGTKEYIWEFAPIKSRIYKEVNGKIKLTFAKKKGVLLKEAPKATDITYGLNLSNSFFEGGVVVAEDNTNLSVPGVWSWEYEEGASYYVPQAQDTAQKFKAIFTPSELGYKSKIFDVYVKVNKRDIIVTPTYGLSKYIGENDPELTYQYIGHMVGEKPVFSGYLNRVQGEDLGSYAITRGSLKLVNSSFTSNPFKASNYNLVLNENANSEYCFRIYRKMELEYVSIGDILLEQGNPNEPFELKEYDGKSINYPSVQLKVPEGSCYSQFYEIRNGIAEEVSYITNPGSYRLDIIYSAPNNSTAYKSQVFSYYFTITKATLASYKERYDVAVNYTLGMTLKNVSLSGITSDFTLNWLNDENTPIQPGENIFKAEFKPNNLMYYKSYTVDVCIYANNNEEKIIPVSFKGYNCSLDEQSYLDGYDISYISNDNTDYKIWLKFKDYCGYLNSYTIKYKTASSSEWLELDSMYYDFIYKDEYNFKPSSDFGSSVEYDIHQSNSANRANFLDISLDYIKINEAGITHLQNNESTELSINIDVNYTQRTIYFVNVQDGYISTSLTKEYTDTSIEDFSYCLNYNEIAFYDASLEDFCYEFLDDSYRYEDFNYNIYLKELKNIDNQNITLYLTTKKTNHEMTYVYVDKNNNEHLLFKGTADSDFSGLCSNQGYKYYSWGGSETWVYTYYDNCNPFGMIAGDFGNIADLSKHTSETASDSTIQAFNSLSELFATFMDNFEIPTNDTTFIPTVSGNALDNYNQFYNKAIEIYNNSLVSFAKGFSNNVANSAVVGLNYPYTMTFGTDIDPATTDYQALISTLFGYRDNKSIFIDYAKTLATTYATHRDNIINSRATDEALDNGCFYTSNGSFVFPIAVKNDFGDIVLTYVILDANGFVSIWINDITSVLKAINFNNLYHVNCTVTNYLYCKNILFITGLKQFISASTYEYDIETVAGQKVIPVGWCLDKDGNGKILTYSNPFRQIGTSFKVYLITIDPFVVDYIDLKTGNVIKTEQINSISQLPGDEYRYNVVGGNNFSRYSISSFYKLIKNNKLTVYESLNHIDFAEMYNLYENITADDILVGNWVLDKNTDSAKMAEINFQVEEDGSFIYYLRYLSNKVDSIVSDLYTDKFIGDSNIYNENTALKIDKVRVYTGYVQKYVQNGGNCTYKLITTKFYSNENESDYSIKEEEPFIYIDLNESNFNSLYKDESINEYVKGLRFKIGYKADKNYGYSDSYLYKPKTTNKFKLINIKEKSQISSYGYLSIKVSYWIKFDYNDSTKAEDYIVNLHGSVGANVTKNYNTSKNYNNRFVYTNFNKCAMLAMYKNDVENFNKYLEKVKFVKYQDINAGDYNFNFKNADNLTEILVLEQEINQSSFSSTSLKPIIINLLNGEQVIVNSFTLSEQKENGKVEDYILKLIEESKPVGSTIYTINKFKISFFNNNNSKTYTYYINLDEKDTNSEDMLNFTGKSNFKNANYTNFTITPIIRTTDFETAISEFIEFDTVTYRDKLNGRTFTFDKSGYVYCKLDDDCRVLFGTYDFDNKLNLGYVYISGLGLDRLFSFNDDGSLTLLPNSYYNDSPEIELKKI